VKTDYVSVIVTMCATRCPPPPSLAALFTDDTVCLSCYDILRLWIGSPGHLAVWISNGACEHTANEDHKFSFHIETHGSNQFSCFASHSDIVTRASRGATFTDYTGWFARRLLWNNNYKMFWEELITYFPWYDTGTSKMTLPIILQLLHVYSLPW
jgi:hypothetical protein